MSGVSLLSLFEISNADMGHRFWLQRATFSINSFFASSLLLQHFILSIDIAPYNK
jgi:hypothetical protein